jgi:hypothetical protein
MGYGDCQCGCGRKTEIAHINRTARNWVKGEPKRFVAGHNNAHVRTALKQPAEYKLINLGAGRVTKISNQDFARCSKHTWSLSGNGYAMCCALKVYLHRFILRVPKGSDTDHKDRDRLNNQRGNLRAATRAQNNMNGKTRSQSGYKGVVMRRGNYDAKIKLGGKIVYLGRRPVARDAALLYDAAALKHFGEFACTNEMLGLL